MNPHARNKTTLPPEKKLRVLLLALIFLDQLVIYHLWHLFKGGKLHGEFGLALGQRAQVGGLSKHLGQRHIGLNHGIIALFHGPDNDAAPLINTAHD